MYMNAYQKYIEELLDEYGPLLCRQLLAMVNNRFKTELSSLDGYISQMCKYGEYETHPVSKEILIAPKGAEPDYDIIRAFDVMMKFLPNVIWHRKSRYPVALRFFVNTSEHDKEISVIPVKQGEERTLSQYADDKFGYAKCEVVIYLLETKAQMKHITSHCYQRFAVIGKSGVVFYKPEEK